MSEQERVQHQFIRFGVPAVILFVGVFGMWAMGSKPPVATRANDGGGAPLVTTIPATRQDKGLDIKVEGHVVPFREIVLAAEVAGSIEERAEICRAGKYVKTGTPLLKIDDADYAIELDKVNEELNQAKANLEDIQVDIVETEKLLKVAEEIFVLQEKETERFQKSRDVLAESELDRQRQNQLNAQSTLLTHKKQLQTLKAREPAVRSAVKLTAARKRKAELDVARTTIESPINGVIVREEVEVDSYVNKGTPLVAIEDIDNVEVKCNLRMNELYWLWCQSYAAEKHAAASKPPGLPDSMPNGRNVRDDYEIPKTPVSVTYTLGDWQYRWHGKLDRYEGIGLDEATRTVPCRVLVENPRDVEVLALDGRPAPEEVETFLSQGPPALVRGMYVTVEIHASPCVPLFAIPEQAIRPGDRIWRVRNGKLHIVDVRVIDVRDKVATVWADARELRVGDNLVISPMAFVQDGMAVRVEQQAGASQLVKKASGPPARRPTKNPAEKVVAPPPEPRTAPTTPATPPGGTKDLTAIGKEQVGQ